MNTKTLKNLVLGFALGSFGLVALATTIPNAFTSGTVISSSAMNQNFSSLGNAVTTLEGKVTALQSTPSTSPVGITQSRSGLIPIPASGPMIDVVATTITIPSAGLISVIATGTATVITTTTGFCGTDFQIDESAGGTIDPNYVLTAGVSMVGNSLSSLPISANRVYSKPAGTYTFRLEASRNQSTGITQSCGGNSFTNSGIAATYIPTSYGSVASVGTSVR